MQMAGLENHNTKQQQLENTRAHTSFMTDNQSYIQTNSPWQPVCSEKKFFNLILQPWNVTKKVKSDKESANFSWFLMFPYDFIRKNEILFKASEKDDLGPFASDPWTKARKFLETYFITSNYSTRLKKGRNKSNMRRKGKISLGVINSLWIIWDSGIRRRHRMAKKMKYPPNQLMGEIKRHG